MENLINKEMIILDLEAETKSEVIEKLAKVIEGQNRLWDYSAYVEQVYERENEFPTSIGFDVSIPHGKCSAVKSSTVAFARLKKSVKWSEDEDVRYVFLLAVPSEEAGNTHLKILAQLSRKLMREEFREQLEKSQSVNEILDVLELCS